MNNRIVLDRMTAAAMAEVKRQLGGRRIPGTPNESYWSAEGNPGSLDFALIIRAAVVAARDMEWDGPDEHPVMEAMRIHGNAWGCGTSAWKVAIDAILAEKPEAD